MQSGILYSIATPIGHLDDITLRALHTLATLDLLVCEDTRETRNLLNHHHLNLPLLSYHAQSPRRRVEEILDALRAGKRVGCVADRGTPGTADPGSFLIARDVDEGYTVVPLPGPAAFLAALQAAGVHTERFSFLGFAPHKKGRQSFLRNAIATPHTVIFYESPHRIVKCLQELSALGIGQRPVVVGRELTKIHEEFLRADAHALAEQLAAQTKIQGEFVIILNAIKD